MWYVCCNPLGYAGLNLISESTKRHGDALYGFQSEATKCFAVTIYRKYELQMLEPIEGNSYINSTGSDNSCIARTQDVVKACEKWINGIVEKKSRGWASLQNTRDKYEQIYGYSIVCTYR